MAARLEAASKQYKVQLLLSDAFVKEISNPKFKAGCRPLDVVTVKGSNVPITLFTFQPNEMPETMTVEAKMQFRDAWLQAFDAYVIGDWDKARSSIEQCLALHPEDGPCETMLRDIAVPTLVLHGEDDPLVPCEGGRDTAASIPGARLKTIPGWGHDLPLELVDELAGAIGEHARQSGGGKG